jgi:hypothetical protein
MSLKIHVNNYRLNMTLCRRPDRMKTAKREMSLSENTVPRTCVEIQTALYKMTVSMTVPISGPAGFHTYKTKCFWHTGSQARRILQYHTTAFEATSKVRYMKRVLPKLIT